MTPARTFDLDLLLREEAWLRAFVRRLVDRDDIDDVVQQTWLAALQRPLALREPRAWLSALAANLARLLHRRSARQQRRERRVAHRDALPATADTVARLEVQRCVAAAVCALPEPTRSALLLHYHDGLDAVAIAARIGGTPAGVRKRLQRGRDRVRIDLQRRFGSDWRASPAVLALAGVTRPMRSPRPTAAEIAAPTILPLTALATGLAGCLVAFGVLLPERGTATPALAEANLAAAPVRAGTSPPVESVRPEGEALMRIPVATEQEPSPDGARAIEPPIVVRGRCLAAEDGTPLAGVPATARAVLPLDHPDRERRLKESSRTVTDRDGRFEFAVARPARQVEVDMQAAARMARRGSFDVGAHPIDLGEIRIPRAFTVRVRIVDVSGAPVGHVAVKVPLPIGLNADAISVTRESDDGGRLPPFQLPAGRHTVSPELYSACGLLDDVVEVREDPAGTDVVLRVERRPSISGVAFDPAGRPVADLCVQAIATGASGPLLGPLLGPSCGSAWTRADGSFELYHRGDRPDDEVRIHFGRQGPFEPGVAPATYKWNTSGLRLDVERAQQVELTVVERASQRPIEAFKVDQLWSDRSTHTYTCTYTAVGENELHLAGRMTVERILRCRNVLVVVPDDPMLAPSRQVVIDGDGTAPAPVRLEVERLQPFVVTVLDGDQAPPAGTVVDVMEARGAAAFRNFDDCRARQQCTGPEAVAMRLSTGSTDRDGKVTLLATPSCVDLRIVVRRSAVQADDHVQILTALPANDEVLRVELPRH